MTDTLFDLTDSPSPRLEWMRRHGVQTFFFGDSSRVPWRALVTKEILSVSLNPKPFEIGEGKTEIEALECLARINNLKLWNEE